MTEPSHDRKLADETIELDSTLRRIYAALRSRLNELSVQNIRNTAAAAGFDISQVTAKAEARTGLGSRAEVMPALDRLFNEMSLQDKRRSTAILAAELLRQDSKGVMRIPELLHQHGYEFRGGAFVPIAVMDPRERAFLPTSASEELARAAERIAAGDYSGAITSACGAVDAVMQSIYVTYSLGDPGRVSFQAKVNTAAQHLDIFARMQSDLVQRGVDADSAREITENAKKATNHAAQALQILRRAMGDAHGSKPASSQLAYDVTKWAAAICGLFEGQVS
jgi:hypothetical protein